ncbi:MAG: AMP-binding protein [Actinobacteria bacterium]|nr:AMP-binding protein [Actinomycetota bacterium]MBU1944114.1 AMP-binding protein [Actinomycetota bacterium]MBU2686713.1 AMP-binding protein [Actinomycetota bacterium]
MTEKTLYSVVERNARVVPDRLAVHWGQERITWREVHENVNRAANFMLSSGVMPGHNVGVMLRNGNQFIEAFVAAPAVGARPFNINYRYKEEELRYVLDNAGAVMVFINPEYEDLLEGVRPSVPTLRHVVVVGRSRHGNPEWSESVATCSAARPEPPWGPGTNDGEILFYTGGTTGMPKGVRWPQENVLAMIANSVSNALVKNLRLLADAPPPGPRNLLDMLDLPLRGFGPARNLYLSALKSRRLMDRATDLVETSVFTPPGRTSLLRFTGSAFRLLIGSPFMHGAAWIAAMPCIAAAGTIYLLPDSQVFDADAFWRLVADERIRIAEIVGDAFAVPLLAALDEREYDLDCLAVIGSGAVKLSPVMKTRFHELLPNAIIVDSLLATEGGGAVSEVSGARTAGRPHRFKIDSTGRFPVMVIDPEGDFVRPGSGATGRLAYGGRQSIGYWNDPEKTAETYVEIDGETWVILGDLCRVEADGSIEFIGREQTCINSGGEKIFPYELEDMLLAHPAVRDLVVVGVPHPRWGEAVTAVIELDGTWEGSDETASALRSYARERISDFKVPKNWVFVESVGRSASGKVPYGTVRGVAMERLGIGATGKPLGMAPADAGVPADRR